MDKMLGTHLHILVGCFSIHTYQLLLPHPLYLMQTTLDECIQNFSEFQYCIDWGAGESCRKILKRMHGFIRQPEITENYEHCVTVPATLVQDCKYVQYLLLFPGYTQKKKEGCSQDSYNR